MEKFIDLAPSLDILDGNQEDLSYVEGQDNTNCIFC